MQQTNDLSLSLCQLTANGAADQEQENPLVEFGGQPRLQVESIQTSNQ
jgi:hypothetical protein